MRRNGSPEEKAFPEGESDQQVHGAARLRKLRAEVTIGSGSVLRGLQNNFRRERGMKAYLEWIGGGGQEMVVW